MPHALCHVLGMTKVMVTEAMSAAYRIIRQTDKQKAGLGDYRWEVGVARWAGTASLSTNQWFVPLRLPAQPWEAGSEWN